MTIFFNPEQNIRANEKILHMNYGLTPLDCSRFGWVELSITPIEYDDDLFVLLDSGTEQTVDGWSVKWSLIKKDIDSVKNNLIQKISMYRKMNMMKVREIKNGLLARYHIDDFLKIQSLSSIDNDFIDWVENDKWTKLSSIQLKEAASDIYFGIQRLFSTHKNLTDTVINCKSFDELCNIKLIILDTEWK